MHPNHRNRNGAGNARDYILIRGARQHNLKALDLDIPKRKLVVITGPSGSGKSSLAFDTIFAEGQRRYVESLSAYARQFLERMEKPDVDYITGLAPAIAIEQKARSRNPRSTVATQTEIYDYLRMLFAQIGRTVSPVSGQEVIRDSPRSVAESIQSQMEDGCRFYVTFDVEEQRLDALDALKQRGFFRLLREVNRRLEILDLNEVPSEQWLPAKGKLRVLVDRLKVARGNSKTTSRIADSVEQAFTEGLGQCGIVVPAAADRAQMDELLQFTTRLERDGLRFPRPVPQLFAFNSPIGACPECKGSGVTRSVDRNHVIIEPQRSLSDGAFKSVRIPGWEQEQADLLTWADEYDIDVHAPYEDLPEAHQQFVWWGMGEYAGLYEFFESLHKRSSRMLASFSNRISKSGPCATCNGMRLRREASYVQIGGLHLAQVLRLTTRAARLFFDRLSLTTYEQEVGKLLLAEIRKRLQFLDDVGLDYLTLDRRSQTLSGGESQRISLATSLGSALVGALYVLDEPTIGLHSRDTQRLVDILRKLRNLGNSVIVVEHDPDVMRSSEHIIDLGPGSGQFGGELTFAGSLRDMVTDERSLTGAYLSGRKRISLPPKRRRPDWNHAVEIQGACHNNLRDLDVRVPLGLFTCVTGVSGSGKSTLVHDTLCFGVGRLGNPNLAGVPHGRFRSIDVRGKIFAKVLVDQSPIGRSPRSNPVTYTRAFDDIRFLLANTAQARLNELSTRDFSFNVDGGRCEHCEGAGTITVEMQFLADLYLPCEECNGTRYQARILEVRYKGKNVHELLSMTVAEAMDFFDDRTMVHKKLKPLMDVGLGYLTLGQPAPTLSGGEAQRIRLAASIADPKHTGYLYVFDEPTTGLHFSDVEKLVATLHRLVDAGNSVIVIEHNLELLKSADWIIDLGPEGGNRGGQILGAGTPEEIAHVRESHTGRYLAPLLN